MSPIHTGGNWNRRAWVTHPGAHSYLSQGRDSGRRHDSRAYALNHLATCLEKSYRLNKIRSVTCLAQHLAYIFALKKKKSCYWFQTGKILDISRRNLRASLVVQWLRIHLIVKGTLVQSLVQEDPTCSWATKPMHHSGAFKLQLLKPAYPRAHEVKWNESHSVVSDSLRPHSLYSPWNSPDKDTGVGRLSLL